MALDNLSSNELLNFIIYDTISATPYSSHGYSSETTAFLLQNNLNLQDQGGALERTQPLPRRLVGEDEVAERMQNLAAQGRKKRRRRPRAFKNKKEAETQRMTHITVERNRRKQMNEHLSVLRSLMPQSYVQRGDQASIVGGAIEFVKELEHLLQSLEAQKLKLLQQGITLREANEDEDTTTSSKFMTPPFSQFFVYPQYTWSQTPNKYTSKSKAAAIADIEVTLIETHANLRILWRRSPRQLSKLVAGFQTMYLTILHLSVTTMDLLVLCSISAKLEEECQLTSVDAIAEAVHHMLRIIEEEAAMC